RPAPARAAGPGGPAATGRGRGGRRLPARRGGGGHGHRRPPGHGARDRPRDRSGPDRKSTRLNSSHVKISYAVFCLKKKKTLARTYHNDSTVYTIITRLARDCELVIGNHTGKKMDGIILCCLSKKYYHNISIIDNYR